LRDYGTVDEACFTYAARDLPCTKACKDSASRIVKIDDWVYADPRSYEDPMAAPDPNSLKTAILESPVTAAFYVYTDFYCYSGGIYKYTDGEREGGHAILIVGWNDNPGGDLLPYFVCKNSWGTDWGLSGYFYIAQSQIYPDPDTGVDVDFGRKAARLIKSGYPAPPRITDDGTLVTFWGNIKAGY
jgi:hypothetical protein